MSTDFASPRRPSPGPVEDVEGPPARAARLRRVLYGVIAVALLVLAVGGGWLLGHNGSAGTGASPGSASVDAGFARDMSTHHTQAVVMAGYERDNTSNVALRTLATDIETEQQFQIGEMQGWLDTWHLSRYSPDEMAWMGHGLGPTALMPGMATQSQIHRLESLHGTALDRLFLQLMIHHHQGGVNMAEYAAQHASEAYVRLAAQQMVTNQNGEIIQMEQMLRKLGGHPLPAPTTG